MKREVVRSGCVAAIGFSTFWLFGFAIGTFVSGTVSNPVPAIVAAVVLAAAGLCWARTSR